MQCLQKIYQISILRMREFKKTEGLIEFLGSQCDSLVCAHDTNFIAILSEVDFAGIFSAVAAGITRF